MKKIVAIIPARWGSTRFPGKPLVPILGKPLIQHVWERCCEAEGLDAVIVATDDMRIAQAAFDFGAEVSITKSSHQTGTDRLGEVAARLRGVSHVINVQGDEPAIDPALISELAGTLRSEPKIQMITASAAFPAKADRSNPNQVKVITDVVGNAIYFSRCAIPFVREKSAAAHPRQHLGIYGYELRFLKQFVAWKPTPLEKSESLEQLRAVEHGVKIRVVEAARRSTGVDTPDDIAGAIRDLRALYRRRAVK
jgi:3-deoxy-manno-octulosonate cytidylyltransferase (CMP-KDO synthetase)